MTDRIVLQTIQNFVKEHEISCEDAVFQSDKVIDNALDFIYNLCELTGYYDPDTKEIAKCCGRCEKYHCIEGSTYVCVRGLVDTEQIIVYFTRESCEKYKERK